MPLNVVLVDDDVFDDRGSVDGGTGRLSSAMDNVVYATGTGRDGDGCWLVLEHDTRSGGNSVILFSIS